MQEYTPWVKHLENTNSPILGTFVSDYMNMEETRKAFNIPSDWPVWEECNQDTLRYHV